VPRGTRALLVLDGCLHQLNFETLLAPGDPPRYWIDDVTLEIAPSLGVLDLSAGAAAAPRARALLAIGAPQLTNGDFPPLAQAEREVASVAALFPPERVETRTGAAARPDAYAGAHPDRFALIHFAAHATANRDSPLDSAVILSRQGDDYKLYARDILKVPTRADLVTLSACHSAGARAYAGEGLVGLAWAFLSAGSRHVIAGLWNVEDVSTADLMAKLYRGLRDGRDADDALRAAKLELLGSQTAYRKPFYWAPFMVYTRAPAAPASLRAHAVAR
jgi:CHAT domain-containing protein